MSGILDDKESKPAKIYLLGENGTGKTGSKASLVCAGYKLRIIDTDKGVDTLRGLLTDDHYPYASIVRKHGIDLNEAVRVIPIDVDMAKRSVKRVVDGRESSEIILAPKNADAWTQIVDMLDGWEEPPRWKRKPQEKPTHTFGNIQTWGPDVVLDLDTFSTAAMMCYYYIQQLNGRLGAREEGYDYQRDVGSAQGQLRRLLEWLSSDAIKCNIIINTHINKLDMSSGVVASPEQRVRDRQPVDAKGYPAAIGRALSPSMGKHVNNIFTCKQTGTGTFVKRIISTVPTEVSGATVYAKNSVYLEPEYSVASGLAEIFAALRGQPHPTDLVNAIKTHKYTPPQPFAVRAAQ